MNYFNKLPTITYQGQLVKNLLARAKLSDETRANNLVFQKYTTTELDRIDNLSNDYYDNPGYSWLIWFSNDTIDPYYDFALTEFDFIEYIKIKYGSLEKAARSIAYFRVNWDSLEPELTPQQFDAAGSKKKYYTPVLSEYLQAAKYVLRRDDTSVSSNIIVQVELSNVTGTFVVNEELQQSSIVYGTVASVTGETLLVKNILEQGSTFTVGATVIGKESGASATVASVTILARPIPIDEIGFWQPVSFLDMESELNEAKKNIKLLDARYKTKAEDELKRVMRDR